MADQSSLQERQLDSKEQHHHLLVNYTPNLVARRPGDPH